MPSNSSGRITKARKGKNSTPHQKNHRWESFSTKISKFSSLQPLRKVRRHDLESEDLSTSTSYFQTGLQRWGELNVSKHFVAFKREVLPLCESLPQLLHFEQRIMDSLAKYISLQEKESLEPLLDLLTAFSHDLGVRFEKHYGRSLDLIVAVAGKPQDVEVIEWTFGALAFLFKYLSKLLVPDLRPTFNVLTPLLGKSRHPPHIARFAAEALSFLVKKAAAPSHRETALKLLVEHAKEDLCSIIGDRQFTLYQDGLMTMFAEVIKGTDNLIHSTGPAIFATLIHAIPDRERSLAQETIWTDVVCGILTSVIHHSNADTFEEFASAAHETVENEMKRVPAADVEWQLVPLVRIYGTLAGVRKGSRINDWAPLVRNLVGMLSQVTKTAPEVPKDTDSIVWNSLITNIAIIWQHAPIDALIPHITPLMQSLSREPFMKWFIPFCSFFCELDSQRFGSLLRSEFQKFIASHWSEGQNQEMLCILLPKMVENRAFPAPGEKDSCRLPQGWQDQIVSKFERLEISPFPERGPYNKDPQVWRDRCLPKYSGLLEILELTTVHPSTNARIAELLLRKLKLALRPSSTLASDEVHFIVGQGFHAYLRMSKAAGSVDATLSPLLRAAVPRFAQSASFLGAYLAYQQIQHSQDAGGVRQDSTSSDDSASEEDPVMTSLVENLSSPSHGIRLVSLELLKEINPVQDTLESIDTMIDVETTPLGLSHARVIAMYFRKLAQNYSSFEDGSWLHQAIPAFLFGMLTVKLSPVWDDSVETMKQIAQTKPGENAICATAFKWLNVPSARWGPSQPEGHSQGPAYVSEFECTNMRRLEKAAADVEIVIDNPDDLMLQAFDEKQRTAEAVSGNSRSRALKVLGAIPFIAEKRSRQLVPHLLAWTSDDQIPASDEQDQSEGATWSLADRKALMGVFAQFINPRALYRHEEVYTAFLQLMENGDAEIQRLALKAILAWKQEAIKSYQENLEFLLDEARFKNELTVFLQDDNAIKAEHRADLMPVLLRLLYGRTISKKGAASGRHGLHATRLAVLRNLSVEDMGSFLDIATGKLKDVKVVGVPKKSFDEAVIPIRKQVGFLNMISAVISELGSNITPYIERILHSVLYCLVHTCRQLSGNAQDAENVSDEEEEKASTHSLLRITRSTGLKCLIALFQNAQAFQWAPYHDLILEEIVAPRLENLPNETAQGISGMLQLVSTWSVLPRVALFLAPHDKGLPVGILPKLIECLSAQKAKDEVKIYVLTIIRNLVKLAIASPEESEFNEVIMDELLDPNARSILTKITTVLDGTVLSNDLLEACVETILAMAPIIHDSENTQSVIKISIFLLKQPPRRVNPRLKGRILLILEQYVSGSGSFKGEPLLEDVYDTISSLFSYFKDRENRQSLSRALRALAEKDTDVSEVATLCDDLNSFKEGRIEEPDYDRRLAAFTSISSKRDTPLAPKQWLPLLHNLIFLIRDDDEFGILSSNSADGIRRLIGDAALCAPGPVRERFEAYLQDILMPAVYAGSREPSETVRREYLRVVGFLLTSLPEWGPIADLEPLLNERTEESAEPLFFFNILSPATSKQLEALQILEAANQKKELGSQNLAQFFIPLLEHFIFGRADGSDDHGLGAQATNTIGALAMSLHWKHYRTTFQRYIGYVESKPDLQKQTIRLLGKFADALVDASQKPSAELMEVDQVEVSSSTSPRLTLSVPKSDKLSVEVENVLLPTLVKHLHEKDESEVSYRVPVGVIIVKLLKLLPSEQMEQKLAGVLTDISHILRSKAWEAREMARDTLVKIAVNLGSSYFGFILRELRGALKKGYQMHVLSYTMHSILVATVPGFAPGDLDYCLPSIVVVIMDDIFGTIGQEKDAEGYTSQMKEIKSSKSQDSMELIAKNASVNCLIDLVKPLQSLLMQKVDLKIIRKIDALMARITAGLLQNPGAETRDTLVFCYEVIQVVYNSQKPEVEIKLDPRIKKYLVQKGAKKSGERGRTTKNTYKLTRFAIDILRAILKKHDSLRNAANIAGFIPILGDAILSGEDEVKISTFRFLAVIVKVPFPNDDATNIYKVAVKEATKSISMDTSTTTELSQAALKMLAVVLRDRRDVTVKDAAIDMLLGKLKDDLTEPLYRHVTFNFLRSVLDHHIETASIYDTMDYVGTVMITNDDKDTRDLARGAFFQFIREYPQKKARWAKQLNFVVANLKYDREGGRLSVMEIVHLLLMKSSDDFVQEIAATCFLPLFLVLANDDSEKCRLAAAELIKEIFRKSDKERTQTFLGLVRTWLEKDDNDAVLRLALVVFSHYLEAHENASKNKNDFKLVMGKVTDILKTEDISDVDGDLLEAALGVIHASVSVFPDKVFSGNSEDMWIDVFKCLAHPETPVRIGAIGLISSYLADFAQEAANAPAGEAIEGSHGLVLDLIKVQDLVRLALGVIATRDVDETLAAEAIQVLVFLGPRLLIRPTVADEQDDEEDQEDADEEEGADQYKKKDLQYLFWRLSHIIRREIPPKAVAITPKIAAMEVLETICRRSSVDRLKPSLKTILIPLHNLTDPSIAPPYSSDELFKTKHEALKTRAQILMDSLQKKFGTGEYTKQLLAIREEVRAKREQRSSKRKIEAIAYPEKYGRDKRKKFDRNKERKKVRSKEQKAMRQSYKGW